MQKIKTNEQGMGTAAIVGIVAVIAIVLVLVFSGMNDDDADMMMNDDAAMMQEDANMDDMSMDMDDEMMAEDEGVMVGGAMMVPSMDIVENAMNADNVTTVVAAVSAAGLVDTLQSEGPFTVFAPNNEAFEALPAGTVDTLLMEENQDDLVNILTYHVVAGAYTSADLEDGQMLTTVQGEQIEIGKTGNQITVNGTAMVETADVISSNGVTFVIDGVLLPSDA